MYFDLMTAFARAQVALAAMKSRHIEFKTKAISKVTALEKTLQEERDASHEKNGIIVELQTTVDSLQQNIKEKEAEMLKMNEEAGRSMWLVSSPLFLLYYIIYLILTLLYICIPNLIRIGNLPLENFLGSSHG